MKSRSFKNGKTTYKTYIKAAGKGYEVGLSCGTKAPLFVGNFIHKTEAQTWFDMMNKEYERFSKKYGVVPSHAKAFYHRFVTNTMYKHYYDYLDKCFGKYTKNFHRDYNRDSKKFNQMRTQWDGREAVPYTRRAS